LRRGDVIWYSQCVGIKRVRDTISRSQRGSPPVATARFAGLRVQEASVTAVAPQPIATRPYPTRKPVKGSTLLRLFRTTDHKQIGIMYLVTTFAFFLAGGAMAMLIRTELAVPGQQFLSQEQY